MTTDNIVTNYTPVLTRPMNMGVQKIYRFANGFGASVIQGPYSYGGSEGLWELGVIRFDGDDWRLTYDTAITEDVLGYQTDSEIADLLRRIDSLDASGQESDGVIDGDIVDTQLAIEGGAR
jgi:hypothetical protein